MIRLLAVGDICFGDHPVCPGFGMHSEFLRTRERSEMFPFADVAEYLRTGDLCFANLESVLSYSGVDWDRLDSVEMRGHPDSAKRIRKAGFNVLNVANNHSLQHGDAAFEETVTRVLDEGIELVGLHDGSGTSALPRIVEVNGLSVGFLGYAFEPERDYSGVPPYAYGPRCDITDDIGALKRAADVVICSLHWGSEFVEQPAREEVQLAHELVDAGADVILGHHPHVLRGVERYGSGLIAYSLGNFVCDMIWDERLRRGLILSVDLSSSGVSAYSVEFVRTDDDYNVHLLSGPSRTKMMRTWEGLCAKLETTLSDTDYANVREEVLRRNRFQSYGHCIKNCHRYSGRILRQMVARSLRRKLTRN